MRHQARLSAPGQWLAAALAVLIALSSLSSQANAGPDRTAVRDFWREVFAHPPGADAQPVSPAELAQKELGRTLFHSPALSRDGARSCASCHDPALAFTDGQKRAKGRDGNPLPRNTPTLFNVRWGKSFNWDGSAETLEAQALGPILSVNELAGDMRQIIGRVSGDAGMMQLYRRAFPGDGPGDGPGDRPGERHVSQDGLLEALSSYTRTLVSPPTRFDAWIEGDAEALTDRERQGFEIFTGKGGCVACHVGWRFSDGKLHDIGLAPGAPDPAESGNRKATGKRGIFAFKTPTLRALTRTAPYMHDGRFADLSDVLDHYTNGIEVRRGLAPNLASRLDLTAEERDRLIAFLMTL